MATRQVKSCQASPITGGGAEYLSPVLPTIWSGTQFGHRWLHKSTFRDASFELDAAPGVGNTLTFTFCVGTMSGGVITWVPSSMVITITGTATRGDSNAQVLVQAGQYVTWQKDFSGSFTGPFAIPNYSIVIDGTETGVSGYGGIPNGALGVGYRTPLFDPREWVDTSLPWVGSFASADGALVALAVDLTAAPGTGNSRSFTIELNDGTDLATLTIADDATAGLWTGVLSMVNGPFVRVVYSESGTPAPAGAAFATKYAAAVDGQSHVCGFNTGYCPRIAPAYSDPAGNNLAWDETESNVWIKGGNAAYTLSRFRVRVSDPSNFPIPPFETLRGQRFYTRRNGVNGPFVHIEDQSLTGVDESTRLTIAPTDHWSVGAEPETEPHLQIASFGWVQTAIAGSGIAAGAPGPLVWVEWPRRIP